jgi:hypothetical protein
VNGSALPARIAANKPPAAIEDNGAAFVMKDGGGQKLAYDYLEDEPTRQE